MMLCISASVTAGSVRVVLISVCKGQNCSVMYKALGGDRENDFKSLEENFQKYECQMRIFNREARGAKYFDCTNVIEGNGIIVSNEIYEKSF